jgi:peroxiredoxin family protein
MTSFATWMMRGRMRKHNVNTIAELLDLSKELGVRLIACDFTVQVFGYREEDFIDGVEFAGAAAFLSQARRAHTTLFI